jgi:hypothetical protein
MAKQNTDKILIGHAINTNSLLSKIEYIAAETKESMTRIEEISKTSLSVTSGLAASIAENTAVLKDIKDVLMKKTVDEGVKLKSGINIEKMLGIGGLIAVVGFGVFVLSKAFQATRGVTPKDIAMGSLIMAGLIPVMVVIDSLLKSDGENLLWQLQKITAFTAGILAIAGMVVLTSYALAAMATPPGSKLLTFIAISAALYIQGQIFIQLISAWQFSGLINKYLNANNTNEIMQAMTVMSLNTIIIAGALSMMPDVSPKTAVSFVIASAAMIPLAGALFTVRFALPMLNKIGPKQIGLMGLLMATMSYALIPVGKAAKELAKIEVSEKDVARILQLIAILGPITALTGVMTALINMGKETIVSARGDKSGVTESLLKRDNSRKRNQKMNVKAIGIFALKAVTYLAVGGLMAVALAKAAPYIQKGITAMNSLDYTGLIKFIAVAGLAILAFGVTIGMVVSMVKGKKTETPGLMNLTGTAKSKPAKLSTADIVMAGLVIPMIAIGIVSTALAFKALEKVGIPEITGKTLAFIFTAGIAVLIFGTALGLVVQLMKGKSKGSKGFLKAFNSKPGKMNVKDTLQSSLIIPIIAAGIVATALAFSFLPGTYKTPPVEWSLKAGLNILAFGITYALVTKALQSRRVGFKDIAKGAAAMLAIAASVTGIAYIFGALGNTWIAPPPLWSLTAGLSILAFGITYALVTKALQSRKVGFKDIAKGAVAMAAIAASIVGISFIFGMLGNTWNAPPVEWTQTAGLALLAFGAPFAILTVLFAKFKVGYNDMFKGALATILVAVTISAVSWIFSFLEGTWSAPPIEWSKSSGIAILAFGVSFAVLTMLFDKMGIGYGGMLKGAIGMVVVALAIVGVAWIFTWMPDSFASAPPIDWSLSVALALVAFTVPALIIGLIATSGVGAVGILLGVVGMIVIAAGMLAVAWILSAMPDLGAISKNFTDALMTPINAIIDAFARIKNEIGVENLLSLALGVAALGVAWLVFVGATAGASIAGGVGNLIGGLLDGIAGLFGGDQPSPIEILSKLAELAPKIQSLAKPLTAVAKAFGKFSILVAGGAVEKIGKLVNAVVVPISEDVADALGITDINKYLNTYAKTMRSVASSYGQIAAHSNSMNVEAIRASTDMFNALAYLASAGKDNALAQLGDKLILAVKELASMIADFEGTVAEAGDTNNQASSSISNAASNLVDKLTGFFTSDSSSKPAPAAQAGGAGGGSNANTQEIDVSSIVRAIQELEDTLTAQGIKIKEI